MKPPFYSWADDYFCAGCLIYSMTQHEPWSDWAEGRDLSDYRTLEALNSMRRHFNLTAASARAAGFPTTIHPTGMRTAFCASCLTLLDQLP